MDLLWRDNYPIGELMKPGTIIEASDRKYIVGKNGEWRVLEYTRK